MHERFPLSYRLQLGCRAVMLPSRLPRGLPVGCSKDVDLYHDFTGICYVLWFTPRQQQKQQ